MSVATLGAWELLGSPAGAIADPAGLPAAGWLPAVVPGTVAQALAAPLDGGPPIDAQDWWYRTTLGPGGAAGLAPGGTAEGPDSLAGSGQAAEGPGGAEGHAAGATPPPGEQPRLRLCFEGLATLATIWLDGAVVLEGANMFRPRAVEVVDADRPRALVIVFRSVTAALAARRARPRWRTALVDHQNLRWVRTALVGRIPGWTPPLPAIGPWRAVRVEAVDAVDAAGPESTRSTPPLAANRSSNPPGPGDGPVYRFSSVDRPGLLVDGVPVTCRGACWTVDDVRAIDAPAGAAQPRDAVRRLRAAGGNLLRVGGTMVWASDALLDACDAEGVLLWQDLPLANMDYPVDDPAFRAELEAELVAQLRRLAPHPCVAVLCGGSEVEQQAAMMGLPREAWSSTFLTERVPELLATHLPRVAWVPSTPTGGVLPFHTAVGLTHYYGVGAYQRPLEDVRRADVAFTPECLGFANVPSPEHVERHFGVAAPAVHLPAWKAGVPRDNGAGWDFEDVRDHYLQALFAVDPPRLRYADLDRYHALSRVVTGELMLRTFAEWRRPASGNRGALVWFWRDLRPGAGWGVLDSDGQPKPCYWYLKRAWAPLAVLLTDEGLNGVDVHVRNDTAAAVDVVVEVERVRASEVVDPVAGPGGAGGRVSSTRLQLPAGGGQTLAADAIIGAFTDLSWAYRFGPPQQDVVLARLLVVGPAGEPRVVHEDAIFPAGHGLPIRAGGLEVEVAAADSPAGDGAGGPELVLTLRATRFLQGVSLGCPGWEPEDDYFHLAAGRTRTVRLRPGAGRRALRGWVTALNLEGGVAVRWAG